MRPPMSYLLVLMVLTLGCEQDEDPTARRSSNARKPSAAAEQAPTPKSERARATAMTEGPQAGDNTQDDYGNDAWTATRLRPSEPRQGTIEAAHDIDAFGVELQEDTRYAFFTETTGDTWLTLMDTDGTTKLAENDDSPGLGRASRVEHVAAHSGWHYLLVEGYGRETPSYTLHMEILSQPPDPPVALDDHGDDANTATSLTLGTPLAGEIGESGDADWFIVDLVENSAYRFETTTAGDTVLQLLASNGTSVLAENDDAPETGLHSKIEYTATATGRHLLVITGYQSQTPSYTITATDVTPSPPVSQPPSPPNPQPQPPSTPVPEPTPPQPPTSDHGGDSTSATPLNLDALAGGSIEFEDNQDWFVVELRAAHTYEVTTYSQGDTALRVLAPDGSTELAFNDNAFAGSQRSQLRVTPSETGRHYVIVSGAQEDQPAYSVHVTLVESPPLPDITRFQVLPNTDPWHIDFELRHDELMDDIDGHGLRSNDPTTDDAVRIRLIDKIVSYTNDKFNRTADGDRIADTSWRISFSVTAPSGRPGWNHSRMTVGGRHPSRRYTLGVAWLDFGNRRREDNSSPTMGVFSGTINGRYSNLYPPNRPSDRRFVDGSYQLGDGTRTDDRRFSSIRGTIDDWGHALACIAAHEVGHSVGLSHDESDPDELMTATVSSWRLSSHSRRFTSSTSSILNTNLGKD